MPIILDFIFLILIIFYIIRGRKNGLIKSIINLISVFICFLLAIFLSSYLANLTYENLVNIPLSNYISDNFNSLDTQININQFFNDLSNQGSNFIDNILLNMQNKFSSYFEPNNIYQINDIANVFSNKIIYPMFNGIIQLIYFVIIFIILKAIFNIICKIFKCFNYTPILGKLNILLGGVFGFFYGIIVISIILFILNLIFNMMSYDKSFIDNTFFIKYLYNFINLR